ncbi:MAG: glutathione S-transferase family protein [Candidatus Dadabacteria bacterium]|nr:glutathione S-transferase family protein [Candidatus Dadabacteria bacterium]MYC40018.1 glutathione S-transferase family protein [Candidatus Dadabacteria bacterium]
MLTLYDDPISGNGYKVRLILWLTGKAFQVVNLDILNGETRTPEFLAINPNGKIPTLVLEDGSVLSESNAILFHFAEGTDYLPSEAFKRAQVLQWLFWEQYSHEPNIATSRFLLQHRELTGDVLAALEAKKAPGEAALALMEKHLASHIFLVAETFSIADIALYAYTHVAEEGGFALDEYPAIRAWIKRVENVPGFVAMGETNNEVL